LAAAAAIASAMLPQLASVMQHTLLLCHAQQQADNTSMKSNHNQ
jgi:hypothetical protein